MNVLDALTATTEYRARLDVVLGAVSALTQRPDASLYVAEPGGRRLHLEPSPVGWPGTRC